MNRQCAAVRRRLDAIALDQLRAEAARLVEENDQLRERLAIAESCADRWHDDAMRLTEELITSGRRVGLTRAGSLQVIA